MLDHSIEHVALAIAREVQVHQRRVDRRSCHDAGQYRGLRQRELVDAVPEISVRRGIDTIRSGAQVNDVEITLEDLVFRVEALDLDRQQRLLNLPRERDLIVEKKPAG